MLNSLHKDQVFSLAGSLVTPTTILVLQDYYILDKVPTMTLLVYRDRTTYVWAKLPSMESR